MSGLSIARQEEIEETVTDPRSAGIVVREVFKNPKSYGFESVSDVLHCAAGSRSSLSPTGLCLRFLAVGISVLGPTFCLIAMSVGTITMIRKLGVLGVSIWGLASGLASKFGLEVDAEDRGRYRSVEAATPAVVDPAIESGFLEDTILESLPAALRNGVKLIMATLGKETKEAKGLVAGAMSTLGTVLGGPAASAGRWIVDALSNLISPKDSEGPSRRLSDQEAKAFADAVEVPYAVIRDAADSYEEALASG